jgi:hypothetical protein
LGIGVVLEQLERAALQQSVHLKLCPLDEFQALLQGAQLLKLDGDLALRRVPPPRLPQRPPTPRVKHYLQLLQEVDE